MLFEKIELEPGEEVRQVVRKHWFVITMEILSTLLIAILPLFGVAVFLLFEHLHPESFVFAVHLPLVIFGSVFWVLITLMATFMVWTHYFLDLWIITDRRIIVIDQISFFNRKVSSFRLERLQDIKVSIDGIIPTLLNFGTIRAQTAGTDVSNFLATAMPDPRGIQALIQKSTDERLKSLHGAVTQTIID